MVEAYGLFMLLRTDIFLAPHHAMRVWGSQLNQSTWGGISEPVICRHLTLKSALSVKFIEKISNYAEL